RPRHRRHPHHRRPHLSAGARARSRGRAPVDARRHTLLTAKGRSMRTLTRAHASRSAMLDPAILLPAIRQSLVKLDPRLMIRNPVMFAVELAAALITLLLLRDLLAQAPGAGFTMQIVLWLWVTVVFANFAEAVAEGRG